MYASTILIAGLGVAVLTVLSFGPTSHSRQIALLVPPWADNGVELAAGTGLAIVGLHWRHHVIILDTGGDDRALARLQSQGLWLLDATGTGLCEPEFEGT